MPKVLICDDSSLARKHLARTLPAGLAGDVHFASDGLEALELIRQSPFDLMFLDLTMPGMDGYEVLETLNDEGQMLDIVVVSADIQAEAQRRVKSLGALDFIQKPCSSESLQQLVQTLQLQTDDNATLNGLQGLTDIEPIERITEIANVAMGKAASLLAEMLGLFVLLPVPKVNEVEVSELLMAIESVAGKAKGSAVCQGFIGYGISGEALLMLHDTSIKDLAEKLNYADFSDDEYVEVLMDVGNILISTCLKGLEEQMDIHFSQSHPKVLGQHETFDAMLARGAEQWKKTLAIEFDYKIEEHDIQCTLLLLFSEDAIPKLHARTAYLA